MKLTDKHASDIEPRPATTAAHGGKIPRGIPYPVRLRVSDWWAARRDRRGLVAVDLDRLAQIAEDEPAAHLRWIRARVAEFSELDFRLHTEMETSLTPDIENLNRALLSIAYLHRESVSAQSALDRFPSPNEDEMSHRRSVEHSEDQSVVRSRRAREHAARRGPLQAHVDSLHAQHSATQREIAERIAKIHRVFDRQQKIALAMHAHYTRRVETYLRTVLHRHPERGQAMALLPSPTIARPVWVDQPCPWPSPQIRQLVQEVFP